MTGTILVQPRFGRPAWQAVSAQDIPNP